MLFFLSDKKWGKIKTTLMKKIKLKISLIKGNTWSQRQISFFIVSFIFYVWHQKWGKIETKLMKNLNFEILLIKQNTWESTQN